MKIESLTATGFRGFNEKCLIDFHDKLTLICAPNSYGKTSISEALEWLLYGVTSKVQMADSKEEYKGSYRNRHFPEALTPFVKAQFIDGAIEVEFSGELTEEENIKRFVNGQGVDAWPLGQDASMIPRPFILQHALKYLLLVKPDERFQGFACLLGLEELDQIQKNVHSLCTKPDAAIPNEIRQLLKDVTALEARLASQFSLTAVAKVLKKGAPALVEAYKVIAAECRQRVPPGTEETSFLPQLLRIREDAVSKIFEGRIRLFGYSEDEKRSNNDDAEFFSEFWTERFVKKYTDLVALATVQRVLDRAQFFNLGVGFLNESPGTCPFCGQSVNHALSEHIHKEHGSLSEEKKRNEVLRNQRTEVTKSLASLRQRLELSRKRHTDEVTSLLFLKPSLAQLKAILVPKYEVHFQAVEAAISEIEPSSKKLEASYSKVAEALKKVEDSIAESKEEAKLMQLLGEVLTDYMDETHAFVQIVSSHIAAMSNADQVLKHELDTLAGTEDISILVDLLECRGRLEKSFEIRCILDGLKGLRKTIDQYVASKVLSAISGELTSDVMEWYGLIKTTGDPDVHFDGFDMERTRTGDLKARRIQIKAKSYGKNLVSAVSSLSESKLNALGLCVSIATNLKGESPFDFLIIDDPIQSWDAEHEIQFIEVIRKLVECGKQVILLSHNRKWLDQVRSRCRSINGWFYEITSYTETGPHISETPWEQWRKRLEEVDAILKDPTASNVKLQQAEEEIRVVIAETTCELYLKKKADRKSPHNLNSAKVRKMLIECGVKTDLVDRVTQTFQTTDDAHHAPAGYAPQRERLRQYHSWVHELTGLLI